MKKTLTVTAFALIAAAGCGNGSSGGSTTTTGTGTANTTTGSTTTGGGSGNGPGGGTSGLVAEIDGKTLQVQSTSTQTAVSYTAATTFTTQKAATAADVKVGECVTVRAVASDSTASAAPATGSTSPVDAASVIISQPSSDGTCGLGGGGGSFRGGAFPSGAVPSGFPGGGAPNGPTFTAPPNGAFPSGARNGARFGGFGGASGKVTAVSSTGFTVASVSFRGRFNGSAAPTTIPTTRPTAVDATPVVVNTSPSTTYTQDVKGSASDLKVGECVRARGDAASSSTGTVTATSIAITPATNGTCDTGFGGRNAGGTTSGGSANG